ncbi:hypothetical protein COOONC_13869 [Cooperia oncophora]
MGSENVIWTGGADFVGFLWWSRYGGVPFYQRRSFREFLLPPTTFIGGDKQVLTLREIVHRLKRIYCKTTGLEYMHLNNLGQQDWIRQHFEAPSVTELTHDQKKVRVYVGLCSGHVDQWW